jgi:superoxide dismutase, Cu-Zn family
MNSRTSFILGPVAGLLSIVLVAVAFGASTVAADGPPVYSGTSVTTITANVVDGTGKLIGNVQASQDAQGVVQIRVNVAGLTPGDHGIHVHATGACDGPAFASANAHFNPLGKQHGLNNPAGHHAGDLPNLTVAANGTASFTATTADISLLGGANSIFDADGSALVIHASPDDGVTDPIGNSGARIACAVLAAPNPALAAATPVAPRTGSGEVRGGDGIPASVFFGGALIFAAAGGIALRRRVR